jgi:ATP-dependent Clp protease adaptor protein ClpS
MADGKHQTDGEVLERTKQQTKKPELFKVLLINDDYTTMDFVIEILESVFYKQPAEAFRIMMAVHVQGKGLCGLYPHEVAETKVATVIDRARAHGFRCWRRWSLSKLEPRPDVQSSSRDRADDRLP